MSSFASRIEKRKVVEIMESIICPLIVHFNEDDKELLNTGLKMLREADVEEEADIEKWNVIADKVRLLLIEVGQRDPQFKLGETIKYSPMDVADIIMDSAMMLES